MSFLPTPCPKCGKCVMELIEQKFHMATFRCAVCGWEESCTVSYVSQDLKDHQVNVFIAWNRGRPSKQELAVARKMIKKLGVLPIVELASKAKSSARLPLGVYWKSQADELIKTAAIANLHIEYEPIDRP